MLDEITAWKLEIGMTAYAGLIVVMGICGTGKTAVGKRVAHRLGVGFLEGDSFHSPENVEKMRAGIPLTDSDRDPWLRTIAAELSGLAARGEGVVLACSALRRRYREVLRTAGPLSLVHLRGDRQLIERRMGARIGHYMPASLVDSQLAILEPPGEDEQALELDIDQRLVHMVEQVVHWLQAGDSG